jgi:DNA-binding response OmpR family regulator
MAMKKILIVDDDKDLLYSLTAFLTKKNFHVVAAEQGADAIHMAPVLVPDVVLLDINLYDMDGRDVCSELKKNPRTSQIPVMMMSAEIDKALIKKICAADDFIEKPFVLSALYSKIEALTA